MILRLCASAVAFTLVTVLETATAHAGIPLPQEGSESGTVFVTDCGGFDVYDQYVLEWKGHQLVDREGQVIRIIEHVWGSDTLVNSVTGESVSGTINAGETVDFVARTVTESGSVVRITVPGVGVLFFDVGKFIIDLDQGDILFLAGHHHALLKEDQQALADLCDVLG